MLIFLNARILVWKTVKIYYIFQIIQIDLPFYWRFNIARYLMKFIVNILKSLKKLKFNWCIEIVKIVLNIFIIYGSRQYKILNFLYFTIKRIKIVSILNIDVSEVFNLRNNN